MNRPLSVHSKTAFLFGLLTLGLLLHAQEAPVPVPQAIPGAEKSTTTTGGDTRAPGNKDDRVSISFTEASIQDVLRSLASMRDGVNIVIDPNVTGKVSLQLEDVAWDTALKLVTEMNNLTVSKEGNIYRVSRPTLEATSDLMVVMHTPETIAKLSDDDVLKMVGDPSLTLDQALTALGKNPGGYVSHLVANEQPAVDIVKALAKAAGLNFAFSSDFNAPPAATGGENSAGTGAATAAPAPVTLPPVSLNLKNIKLEDALQFVAEQGKLSCVDRNGTWLISPLTTQAAQLEPLKLETFTINYLSLDDDLVRILQGLCTSRGKVTRGKNKILIVHATAKTIDAIRQTLLVMDRPTPQVLIEARFFKVTDTFIKKIGLDWQDLGQTKGQTITTRFGGVKDGFDPALATSATNQIAVDLADASLSQFRYAYVGIQDLSIIAHAAENDDGVTQLANPKLLVNSDEQAFIHIGEQRPIIKFTKESTTAGILTTGELDGDYGGQTVNEADLGGPNNQTSSRSYTTNKGYLDLGTKLTVLPSVKTEEEVYLKVAPEMVDSIGSQSAGDGNSYPVLFRTYVRSQFTIKSGQTIAIGGLVREENLDETNGVPLLNKIPFVGSRLFSYENTNKQRTETIIFLTVKVISGKELTTTSGVPINTKLIQEHLNTIHAQDANGAEYDEVKAQKDLAAKKAAEAEAAIRKNPLKRLFGMDKEEKSTDPMQEPDSYLEEK